MSLRKRFEGIVNESSNLQRCKHCRTPLLAVHMLTNSMLSYCKECDLFYNTTPSIEETNEQGRDPE